MNRIIKDNILQLSVSERIQLVEDIWDSILLVPESVELSDKQKEELDRRLEAYHITCPASVRAARLDFKNVSFLKRRIHVPTGVDHAQQIANRQ